MNTSIGKRIRSYREERGFSQEELAEKLHISRSTYQRIENGETNSWINHIENICTSLNVELDDILKPEEGYTQINKENTSNENSSNNMIQNQTNNYNGSDKLTESLLDQISFLKEENQRLKKEIEQLKNI
ncbi:helix-turn-helix domain-containing protein [Chryseobacterium sp. LC2016-29]|uniref:helix-turn-helix domain-containing protein n=1 Tax=Chryseobacterium sp. LC2016-29 TaxID=2897331 RepID=UPI001E4C48DD|nr:helix-turn-helix transcriptional regulator [Chryseobacterium sp. LC2016-29]MCD0476819.1 helix-turn-helix domain-containing protein [Chryseobacterium sp. LC2016-29]